MAQTNNDKELKILYNLLIRDYETAIRDAIDLLVSYVEESNDEGAARICVLVADAYHLKKAHTIALLFYLASLRFYSISQSSKHDTASILHEVGCVYRDLNNLGRSRAYYEKSLNLSVEEKDFELAARNLNDLALVLLAQMEFDQINSLSKQYLYIFDLCDPKYGFQYIKHLTDAKFFRDNNLTQYCKAQDLIGTIIEKDYDGDKTILKHLKPSRYYRLLCLLPEKNRLRNSLTRALPRVHFLEVRGRIAWEKIKSVVSIPIRFISILICVFIASLVFSFLIFAVATYISQSAAVSQMPIADQPQFVFSQTVLYIKKEINTFVTVMAGVFAGSAVATTLLSTIRRQPY